MWSMFNNHSYGRKCCQISTQQSYISLYGGRWPTRGTRAPWDQRLYLRQVFTVSDSSGCTFLAALTSSLKQSSAYHCNENLYSAKDSLSHITLIIGFLKEYNNVCLRDYQPASMSFAIAIFNESDYKKIDWVTVDMIRPDTLADSSRTLLRWERSHWLWLIAVEILSCDYGLVAQVLISIPSADNVIQCVSKWAQTLIAHPNYNRFKDFMAEVHEE